MLLSSKNTMFLKTLWNLSNSSNIRCFSISTLLNKKVSGKYFPTRDRSRALTHEMSHAPEGIGHAKSWNSFNTSALFEGLRTGKTTVEDEFIRRFISGTWHNLFVSEIIIKRQHNIVRIAGIVYQGITQRKMYFLIGYTEELLSYWLQCPVKLELQTVNDRKAVVFNLPSCGLIWQRNKITKQIGKYIYIIRNTLEMSPYTVQLLNIQLKICIMEFPISINVLRDQFLDKISVPFSSNKIGTKSKNSIPIGGSSPDLTDLKLKEKLHGDMNDRSFYANTSFTNGRRVRGEKLAIEMAHSKSFADLSGQLGCPSPASSISSRDSYHDYTQIKPTYTSNVRCKLARNEPIPSHYYNEHMERYGKPPFVWGVRKSADKDNVHSSRSRRPSSRFEFS